MVLLQGETQSFTAQPFADEFGNNYVMFDPFAILASLAPEDSDTFKFWCATCGNDWEPSLVNLNTLDPGDVPVYPCLDAANVAANSGNPEDITGIGSTLCQRALMWLYSTFWSRATGG